MADAPRQRTDFDTAWRDYLADPLSNELDLGSRSDVHQIPDLLALREQIDVFLLDGFGVLNTGFDAVPGMAAQIAQLQSEGMLCLVLSNGATQPVGPMVEKYLDLGYRFSPQDLLTSRDALRVGLQEHALSKEDFVWGVTPTAASEHPDLPAQLRPLMFEEDFEQVDGFLLLSTVRWSARHDWLLQKQLELNPRPVWVANPDVCAPFPGFVSREPGQLARSLARSIDLDVRYFGKPHHNVYDVAFARIEQLLPGFDKARVAMVGDSPHTDILGARASGIKSVLMQDYGLLADQSLWPRLQQAGIWPDYLIAKDP